MSITTASTPGPLCFLWGEFVHMVVSIPPPVLTFISALLTPVVAIFGLWIARRQWVTAQQKLNLDLFNRRFSVYDATILAMSTVGRRGSIRPDEVEQFAAATRGARFLFNEEVEAFLEQLYAHLDQVARVSVEIKKVVDMDGDPEKLFPQLVHYRNLIGNQWKNKSADALFKKFMRFEPRPFLPHWIARKTGNRA